MDPHGRQTPHVPPPSLWPVGFAIGVAVLLTGLVVGWHIVILGALLTIAFGFLWVRDLTAGVRSEPVPEIAPERRASSTDPGVGAAGATEDEAALPVMSDEEIDRFPRSKFLEGATLGVGGLIGGLVTVPALGFMVIPAFVNQETDEVDIGPLDAYPEGEWRITTYLENPDEGEVTRRTAYIRHNGELNGQPSFTMISNSCVHLGCPVQPSGPVEEEKAVEDRTTTTIVRRIPTNPSGGFICPCHGGAYDPEGNRVSGPPVRALDRYSYAIRNGRVFITGRYSVGEVKGAGKEARIKKYAQAVPGVHVDGPEAWLYPLEPPK